MKKKLHVHVKHLPRLRYLLILTKDYRRRALDEITRMNIPPVAEESRLAPQLISHGKIEIFYQEHLEHLKLEKCPPETDLSGRLGKSSGTGNENMNGVEVIEFQKINKEDFGEISIYLTSDGYQACEQSLPQEHKKNITEYLEKDIYLYVESVNKVLENSKTSGTNHLHKVILKGQAILNENPNRKKEHVDERMYKECASKLRRLPGVLGYGMEKSGLCVLAKETPGLKKEEMHKEIIEKFEKEPNIIWIEEDLQEYTHHAGMRLIPERFLDRYTNTGGKNGYGSLGVFGKTETGNVVATTAGHLFKSEGEKAYIVKECAATDTKPCYKMIGTCMSLLNDHPTDFALVKIEDDVSKNCRKTIWHPDLDTHMKMKLYEKGPGELKGQMVHILQTDFTTEHVVYSDGIVKSDPFFYLAYPDKRGLIAITSDDKRRPFAIPGHSGATVIKIEFENDLPVAKIVATFTHGPSFTPETENASYNCVDKKGDEDLFIAWRMDESLRTIEREKEIKVYIDTTITE